ncbi:MAG: hypothetical protein H5U39_06460 [Deferribacterales bacterium]|jgi:hypothetical protein|nr:hypothetical protein [Deferribacterales bacterium]MBZ4671968.1 hypothetical protein [Deferribacteraceae bacterium]
MNIQGISSYKLAQYSYAYSIKVAVKSKEAAETAGNNILKLINSSVKNSTNKIDFYA